MIDAVLLFAGQWIVVAVLSRQLQAVGMTTERECSFDPGQVCEGPNTALAVLLTLIVIGFTIGYHALFEGLYGATPGKNWMGLRVEGAEGLLPVGLARSTVRSLVRQSFWIVLFLLLTLPEASALSVLDFSVPALLFLVLPVAALGLVAMAAFTADGRGAHDLAAATVVVRTKPLASATDAVDARFGGRLWSDPDQPENLPEHLDLVGADPERSDLASDRAASDEVEDSEALPEGDDLDRKPPDQDREESL